MDNIKSGDYVSFDSKNHGIGNGKVIDIISNNNKNEYVIIEPLYNINEKKLNSTAIKINIKDVSLTTFYDAEKRISKR